jgi:photosystem II stability/assembly factor-like uncharacterized protein
MAKKKKAVRRTTRIRLPKNGPPPDNPLLRHEETDLDRFPTETIQAVAQTLAAAVGVPGKGKQGRVPRGAAPSAASVHGGEMAQMARRRLAALDHSTAMATAFLASRTAPASTAGGAAVPFQIAPTSAGMAPPISGTANWTQLGPSVVPNGQTYSSARVFVTGRVTAIVVDSTDSNVIYVGTAQGGVWKTVDRGGNWKPLTDNELSLAIGALAMDPGNPLVLYAGTGEGNFSGDSYYGAGVLRTVDGGNSWTMCATPTFAGNRFSRIAITPGATQHLFAATNSGLYRSLDGANNWTQLSNGLPAGPFATDVAVDPSNPSRVYAAFWGQGVYRTDDADAANPTWTQLSGGLSAANSTRIAVAVAPSSPQVIFALLSGSSNANPALSYLVNRFYRSADGGTSWQAVPLPSGNIGGQGFYNLNLLVDPNTPDIVYLSGISLWKATRNATTDQWTISNVGGGFHPDNHALAIDPANHLNLYAGSDGGLYRSTDGGGNWDDSINKGLGITQFEFISQHPTSDALVLGGTQDNGTEQFRNSPVFYHSDDGDGGSCAIDFTQPANMLSTYYGATPKRSTQAGKFQTWQSVSAGLAGNALFYPPMTLDATNANNVAFGTDNLYLDSAQGTAGWPVSVTLPGVTQVSAIHYVNSNLIYAASISGQVYRLTLSGGSWSVQSLNGPPLPNNYIWEIRARPDDSNTVVLVMSGFGIPHVWRGSVGPAGATWTAVSGGGLTTALPDIPVNALAIDPLHPDTWFIGTDVGVFRTVDAGATWLPFRNSLPNCAVFDLKLAGSARLLRAATHGRGLWEIPIDATATPDVDLVVRDHIMDTGRLLPSPDNIPAAWDDPLQHVNLGDILNRWECADIKIDTPMGSQPSYQMAVADVDYAAFESRLEHRNAFRGQVARVYVQVRNRGGQSAMTVRVKILAADTTLGLPALPSDFWTMFPNDSTDTSHWQPIGASKTIPVLNPFEPQVLEWDWPVPASAADQSSVLVVMESASDPIPSSNKLLDVTQLVAIEKRVGLKSLQVVAVSATTPHWTPVTLHGSSKDLHTLRFMPAANVGWRVGVVLQNAAQAKLKLDGVVKKTLTAAQKKSLTRRLGSDAKSFDTSTLYVVTKPHKGGSLTNLKLAGNALRAVMMLIRPTKAHENRRLKVVQESAGRTLGGTTFVLHGSH